MTPCFTADAYTVQIAVVGFMSAGLDAMLAVSCSVATAQTRSRAHEQYLRLHVRAACTACNTPDKKGQ